MTAPSLPQSAHPAAPANTAGRLCPLHYRTRPEDFAADNTADHLEVDTLYVVGGLYGNLLALDVIEQLYAADPTPAERKALVFNGDFHWFDARSDVFSEVQRRVLRHRATRGNVETEIANPDYDEAVGCGCGYPDWVDQAIVDRSNRILGQLRRQATAAEAAALGGLPMWMVARVGGQRFGIIHGDPQSLAGWGLAREHLLSPTQGETFRGQARQWFHAAGPSIQGFVCTHTCTPIYLDLAAASTAPQLVLNNGSAGMPNLLNDHAGLITRLSTRPPDGRIQAAVRFGMQRAGLFIDAVGIDYPHASWLAMFDGLWPLGSDAALSYRDRIKHSLKLSAADMVFSIHP